MTGKDMVVFDPKKFARDQERVRTGFWRKLKRYAGKVPFLDEALAGYYCATDPKTPFAPAGPLSEVFGVAAGPSVPPRYA